MNKHIPVLLFVVLFAFSSIRPQVPNGGFEIWTSEINPDYWSVSSSEFEVIAKTSDSHSGQWAVKGECVPYSSSDSSLVAPSILCWGTSGPNGFPVENRFNSLKGFYKLIPQGNDNFEVSLGLFLDTVDIGYGHIELPTASAYTQFSVPINYYRPGIPTSCWIRIGINAASLGSQMYVDDLELSMDNASISDVQGPVQSFFYKLDQNYPNPFNPSTKIKYSVAQFSDVVIKIFDVLGKEVATLVNEEKPPGSYDVEFDASTLTSGIYFYKFQTGSFVDTKKMILQK